MSCNLTWSNFSDTWSSVKATWSEVGKRATNSDIWSQISETWVCFQDTWGTQQPIPPTPSVPSTEDGWNLAMGNIPEVIPSVEPVQLRKVKKKKTIELICIVGTEHFSQKKETREENNIFFNVKKIKFEINRLTEAKLSVTT
jgi:hypothetical protein